METRFTSQSVAEVFRDLYLQERTGVLRLHHDDVEKRVYFDRGIILFADSDREDEKLGPRLVEEGKLSQGALHEATRGSHEPMELARVLINRGLVTRDALKEAARCLVEKVVKSVFRWGAGTARFAEDSRPTDVFDGDIVSTLEFILGGINSMAGFESIRVAMQKVDHPLKLKDPLPLPVERLALSPAHGFVLSRVDGNTTVSDVVSILPKGEEDLACRFLFGLLVVGVVEYDPPLQEGPFRVSSIFRDHADQIAREHLQESMIVKAYEDLRDSNPHQVLGLQPGAPWEAAERAYTEAKEKFSREHLLPQVREKLKTEIAVIESRLVEAFLTLTHSRVADSRDGSEPAEAPSARPVAPENLFVRVEMDKTETKRALEENERSAEAHYAKARMCMREADYHNAIQYGKLAISYDPDDARYYFLVGECQGRNPEARWQRMAEQNFVRATELDPWNVEYRITLGRFYRLRGMRLRAKKQFEQALRIVPSHEDALRELDTLR